MTPDEALRLSAVWACVTVTAKALASCNWDVFLQRPNGDREPRRAVAAYDLLNNRPNPECTAFGYREAMYIQAMTWGDHFSEIETDKGGRPVALWPLQPERCTVERDDDKRLVVVVRNGQVGEVVLPYDDVFHVHGPGVDGLTGYNVVTLAARGLAHAAAAEIFGQSFYHNNMQLGGLISFANNLSEDARKATVEAIEKGRKGAKNAWSLLALDGGAKFQPFGTEPDKAQFVETRHLLIEEVCRWFGVPPHKIAHLLRSTFSNIEHQSIEFVRDALVPWAERSRQEADYKLLRPWPGIRTRIDLEWLQEGDAKSKAEVDSIEVQNGLVTRNEARRRRGRNNIGPDGDKLTLQVNMTTLDKVGMEDPAQAEEPVEAMMRLAVHKALERRSRVASELAPTADSEETFRAALVSDQSEHVRYLAHRIKECLRIFDVDTDQTQLRECMAEMVEADIEMLCAAYRERDLTLWCDIDERSREIAQRMLRALDQEVEA
jgi:HK97 family phage portal protein